MCIFFDLQGLGTNAGTKEHTCESKSDSAATGPLLVSMLSDAVQDLSSDSLSGKPAIRARTLSSRFGDGVHLSSTPLPHLSAAKMLLEMRPYGQGTTAVSIAGPYLEPNVLGIS